MTDSDTQVLLDGLTANLRLAWQLLRNCWLGRRPTCGTRPAGRGQRCLSSGMTAWSGPQGPETKVHAGPDGPPYIVGDGEVDFACGQPLVGLAEGLTFGQGALLLGVLLLGSARG